MNIVVIIMIIAIIINILPWLSLPNLEPCQFSSNVLSEIP